MIKKSVTTIALILCVAISMGQSGVDLSQKLPFDPKVKMGKLDNGLTYFIRQNKKPEQRVELRLVVNAGAINEDDDQQGLAHMAEHMAFNGTKNFKKNDIVSFLQDIGVGFGNDLNAYTSFDETVYILPIPTDKPGNLEKGFQVLEDWAHNVTYITEDIEGERAIILEESRLGKGADDRMFRKIYPKLFDGSKYAKRLPIGIDSIIKNFPPDAIRRFYKDWYRPNLMAVVVVGDIEPAAAEAMIKKHFAGLVNPANERKREVAAVYPYKQTDVEIVTDKEATDYSAVINYPYFYQAASSTVGDYKNDLIERMFATLLNQRLQELTQQSNPPYVRAGVSFGSYARNYNGFSAYVDMGTGDVKKGIAALSEEVERAKRFGFTTSELERAKKNLLATYERAYNNRDKNESGNYVEEYVSYFLAGEPSPGIEKEFELVKQLLPTITIEDLNGLTKLLKENTNRFVYVTGPEKKANDPLPDNQTVLNVLNEKEKATLKPYEEKAVSSSLLATLPKAGKVVTKTANAKLGTTELVLSNGVKVILKPTDFKNDQVIMNAGRFGGKNAYAVADKFSAEYATQIVSAMGVGNFAPVDLRKALAGKSLNVAPYITGTTEGFSGNSTIKDLETFFQLNYLYVTAPRKDTALFRSFTQRNKSQYAMLGSNPQAAFVDTLYKVLFNNNPKAPIVVPNSSYFDKINIDRSVAIYKERLGDVTGMNYVFTGSFKVEEMIPFIEKYIASLPASGKKTNFVDDKVRPLSGKKQLNIAKGKEQKSLILGIYSGEVPYSQDLELKATVLSEVLNIRIIEELREKIQGIYGGGTFAQLEKEPYSNYSFILQLPCGPEKVDTLIKAVQKEFALIIEKGPDQSYLDKVKKQLIEQQKVALKENGQWGQTLLNSALRKADPSFFTDFEAKIDKLTTKDIQQAAKIFLGGPNQFTAVLMPEAAGGEQKEQKKGF